MDIWVAYQQIYNVNAIYGPPFSSTQDLYNMIDSTEVGDMAWQAFSVKFNNEGSDKPGIPLASWKRHSYEVWFWDPLKIMEAQIANRNYACEVDYAPKHIFSNARKGQYGDFMSGNWAWEQAICYLSILHVFLANVIPLLWCDYVMCQDILVNDSETHGSTLVPLILGSDKTTVSIATG